MSTCEVITKVQATRSGLCLLKAQVPLDKLGDMQFTLECMNVPGAKYVSALGDDWFKRFDVYIAPSAAFNDIQAAVQAGLMACPEGNEPILVDGNPGEDATSVDVPPATGPIHYRATTLSIREGGEPVDVYVAEGTGLGYTVEHPLPGEVPVYVHGPSGLGHAPIGQDTYQVIHMETQSPLLDVICFSESFTRRLLEGWARAANWNRPIKELTRDMLLYGTLQQVLDTLYAEERSKRCRS
jgi:hypothetical protein